MKIIDKKHELNVEIQGRVFGMEYDRATDSLFLWREEVLPKGGVLHEEIAIDQCGIWDIFDGTDTSYEVDCMSDGSWGGHTTYTESETLAEFSIPISWYIKVLSKCYVDGKWNTDLVTIENYTI